MKKLFFCLCLVCVILTSACAQRPAQLAAAQIESTPRLLVMTAFSPESKQLLEDAQIIQRFTINGRTAHVGTLYGNPVVLAQSGVSMVNAAMSAQSLLDRFEITAIVFTGIAGGVNPDLHVGDVVIPAEWMQYQESHFARQVGDGWNVGSATRAYGNYGMIFPQPVGVTSNAHPLKEKSIFIFKADPGLLEIAEKAVTSAELDRCVALSVGCLTETPKIVTGGRGVSGPTFVDNADYREWVWAIFKADALDMESAAVAHVAYTNDVPFIAFRSLSDLAGGGPGENELPYFFTLAARNSARAVKAFLTAYAAQVNK